MNKSVRLLVAMREIFGQPALSSLALGVYLQALADLPDADVARVLCASLKTRTSMPIPAEIREVLGRLRNADATEAKAGAGAHV